jgi:hypothetical protein
MNMENPMVFVIFQLNIRIDKNTRINIQKRMAMEQTIPVAETGTGFWKAIVNMNHGNGSLKRGK